ncbi:hypothetical protein N7508_004645 [Penicillium antarcticum]|uniref:uncharacterized protein n=1 Tax=Penicillium antarcticum TaxID=416450 RepID=UPI0023984B27|nr:uncharacterized protein N7508_004645 [Penicillium antarcticum]KAJ5309266.1 hypothetical protein N7508_004645 [Penicillium antarcticum]
MSSVWHRQFDQPKSKEDSIDNSDIHPLGKEAISPDGVVFNKSDAIDDGAFFKQLNPTLRAEFLRLLALDENEKNACIQDTVDLRWAEVGEAKIALIMSIYPQRQNRPRDDENDACPDRLPEARDGPRVDQTSSVYRTLAEPQYGKDVGSAGPRSASESLSNPLRPIADEEVDNNDAVCNWAEANLDTPEYRAWSNAQRLPQLMAYKNPTRLFPIVENGKPTFTSHHNEAIYDPSPFPLNKWDPQVSHKEDWWFELMVSSSTIFNKDVRTGGQLGGSESGYLSHCILRRNHDG